MRWCVEGGSGHGGGSDGGEGDGVVGVTHCCHWLTVPKSTVDQLVATYVDIYGIMD